MAVTEQWSHLLAFKLGVDLQAQGDQASAAQHGSKNYFAQKRDGLLHLLQKKPIQFQWTGERMNHASGCQWETDFNNSKQNKILY